MSRFLVALVCLVPFAAAVAGDIGYVEDFALAKDRAAALKGLIPSTEDYYYYHALHYLNTEQYTKAEALFGPWSNQFGQTQRFIEIQTRHALLTYERNPQKTLTYLRDRLGVAFTHERIDASKSPNLPTKLDPVLIARETLRQNSFARWSNLENFEDAGLDWIAEDNLTWERRRHLLARIARPDVPNLIQHIDRDLRENHPPPFGAHPIHQQLTLPQLEELLRLRPQLLNESAFVNVWITKLRPGADDDWRRDPALTRAYLDRLMGFIRRLAPVHNSLKAHVLFHRLAFDRAQGQFDKALLLEYLRLPRQRPYMAKAMLESGDARRVPADLGANFQGVTLLPPVGDDEALVRAYLEHFLLQAESAQEFMPYINDVYLRHLFAEIKIVNGLGEPERWAAQLPPELYQQIKDRIDIDFAATNKVHFAADEPVRLDLFVKNVPTLIVKVFEVNTGHWYRTQQREVDANINLDGLVANQEQTVSYTEPPQRRQARRFDFPQLSRPGVYVVDFIGGGKASRAVIRKGRLRPLASTTTAGQLVRVVDDKNQPVPHATLWLGGREYAADKDGAILVPFSTTPGSRPIVLTAAGFSCLEYMQHEGEVYRLQAGIYVDREALLPQRLATLVVRPSLLLGGVPQSLRDLEEVRLRLTAVDTDGVPTSTEVPNFKLLDDRDTTYEFRVPGRLAQLNVELHAKIKSLTLNKQIDLVDAERFVVNGIDKKNEVADFHLARFGNDYVLEMLGRTGERRIDRPVTIACKHRFFKEPVQVTLKTDGQGRILLGELRDIVTVSLTTPTGLPRTWRLPTDEHNYSGLLNARAGETIVLPYLGKATAPSRSELALFEVEGELVRADRFDRIALNQGVIELRELPPGDYLLWLKNQETRVLVRVVAGSVQSGQVLGKLRYLELPALKPAALTTVDSDAENVTIRLRDVSKLTRVHVFATRYVPEFSPFAHLVGVGTGRLGGLLPAAAESTFLTGRNIGDEFRYVLDRKLQTKRAGNMLDRPALLLNPWARRVTEGGEQWAAVGQDFAPAAPPAPTTAAPGGPGDPLYRKVPGHPEEAFSANLDFLADGSVALLNLVPNEAGEVKVARAKLGPHGHIHVVAVDPLYTTYRQHTLAEQPASFLDLRLAKGLDPAGHFTQQKQVSVLAPNQTFVLADAVGSRFETYDSLGKVYALYATLLKDPKFAEFSFVTRWPSLKPEEQRELYSKFACHELNFFLALKDPKFFQDVIKPYLANKRDKTFLDQWLLESDLREHLQPWRHGRLNALERILLARRLPGEAPATARHLHDLWRLLPRDLSREQFLYDTAVARGSLDAADVLAGKKLELRVALPRDEQGQVQIESPDKGAAGGMGGGGRGPSPTRAANAPAPKPLADLKKAEEAPGAARDGNVLHLRESKDKELSSTFGSQERERRQLVAQLYRPVAPTQEWAENNYYQLTLDQQLYPLISINHFWLDYARHDPARPFLSPHVAHAARNFAEALCALAVLDLPFTGGKNEVKFDGNQMSWTSTGPTIAFHEEVKTVPPAKGDLPILVSQHFFRQDDRYREDAGERLDKFVSDEFLIHVVYGCQVVVTNPTPARQRLAVLFQIPVGAMPLESGQRTKTVLVDLDPYRTQLLDFYFYFPLPGRFAHFPVHVAKNEQLVAAAAPFIFNVVAKPTKLDTESWDYISQNGTSEQVIAYLNRENVSALNLELIAWRMKDKAFYAAVLPLLAARHLYQPTLWSYALLHNDPAGVQQYLQHRPEISGLVGGPIRSPLLNLDPVARHEYEHLEYRPLVNARAHSLGQRRQIVNRVLHEQYHRFLKQLSYQARLGDEEQLAVVYYLLLQDRVEEARAAFALVGRDRVAEKMQYDYCAAYLELCGDEPGRARAIAAPYAQHPVDRWKNAFAAVLRQLDEIEGQAVAVTDPADQAQQQTQLAAKEPSVDFVIENKALQLSWQNLDSVQINYYLMDVELLFSRNPFVQQGGEHFQSIRPNQTQTVKLPAGQAKLIVPLPEALTTRNVLVEVVAAGKSRSLPYYSSAMTVQMSENYGQVRVTDPAGKPLPKVYVKTYVRLANGVVKFHKDGYTDHRGRFDYATVSTPEQAAPQRFAVLVLSDERGAQIREAAPPQR